MSNLFSAFNEIRKSEWKEKINADLRLPLKKAGMLTRDSREVERKKCGQPGARKNFQFSKR